MTAAMGGLDVLVFTGGAGERAASIRSRAASLGFPGLSLDQAANDTAHPDADLTGVGAPVQTLVIEAREDLPIAGELHQALQPHPR